MKPRMIAWWLLFITVALWMQHLAQGVDFLVLGLVLSLQEDKPIQSLWLILIFMFIQEGLGSLDFGAGILWYGFVVGLFVLGRWLFEVENVLFILLLGLFLGAWRFFLVYVFSSLQQIEVDYLRLLHENILQAMIIPPGWYVARALRKRFGRAPAI